MAQDLITLASETVRLYGRSTWQDGQRTIRALLFGEMVKRAIPVVQHYYSDLFHDAEWLQENVTGERTFLWMVRFSGTNIDESAQAQERISGRDPRVLYHVSLVDDNGTWSVTFTTLVEVVAPAAD